MELSQHGFLEELLAPRRDTWTSFPSEFLISSGWNLDSLEENTTLAASNPSFVGFSTPAEPTFECPFSDQAYTFLDHGFTVPDQIDSSPYIKNETSSFLAQEDYSLSMVEEDGGELGGLGSDHHHSLEERKSNCVDQMEQQTSNSTTTQVFSAGLYGERKSKAKKLEGQPSKNLMAERRRRKRLNDRLSMLRSIVPKISKMDRTSILGDTIDYMKELLERINKLQEEETAEGVTNQILTGNPKEIMKPNEVTVRNTPKFDVKTREIDTRIDICCAAKPGLLLSTVSTLEALGLEIQQCVISCFNDFSMQASCSGEQKPLLSSEDIKQALFRNAGYGGRCL